MCSIHAHILRFNLEPLCFQPIRNRALILLISLFSKAELTDIWSCLPYSRAYMHGYGMFQWLRFCEPWELPRCKTTKDQPEIQWLIDGAKYTKAGPSLICYARPKQKRLVYRKSEREIHLLDFDSGLSSSPLFQSIELPWIWPRRYPRSFFSVLKLFSHMNMPTGLTVISLPIHPTVDFERRILKFLQHDRDTKSKISSWEIR